MNSVSKQNIRHTKNLSSTALNESLNRSNNGDAYQQLSGGAQSQNSTPSQSQFNTLKKALGTNILGTSIPNAPLRKQKNSPKQQLNLSGSETRQPSMLQQQFYYPGASSSMSTGSKKQSRQDSYGQGIYENLQDNSFAVNTIGSGCRITPKDGDINISQEKPSLSASSNGLSAKQFQQTNTQQSKLYAQVNEQLKQGKQQQPQQQQQQQSDISKILAQSSFQSKPGNLEVHLSRVNHQNKHSFQQIKNASSCSPENKKQQQQQYPSPTLSFQSATHNGNAPKPGQKSLNTTVSGDNRQFLNSSGNVQGGISNQLSETLSKKYSGELSQTGKQTQQAYASQSQQQQQQQAQTPLKYASLSPGGIDPKLQRNQLNNNNGGNYLYPQGANGYLGGSDVHARVRPAPSQGERSPFLGANREKSPYANSRAQLDIQQIINNQVGNLSAEDRGMISLKNREGLVREAIAISRSGSQPQHMSQKVTNSVSQAIQMQTQSNQTPQQPYHRSASSMSNIKIGHNQHAVMLSAENNQLGSQQYSKEPQNNSQHNNSGYKRTSSNPKQTAVNCSMDALNSPAISNGMYYLSAANGNNQYGNGSNNNYFNQTYANHAMNGNNNQQIFQTNQQQQQVLESSKHVQSGLSQQYQTIGGSLHLKQNQNQMKSPELSLSQIRQCYIPTTIETMKNSQSAIATTSGNRSRSPVRKESAKGGQDISESFLSNYERNIADQRRQSNLKELMNYWQGIQPVLASTAVLSQGKQVSSFPPHKQQEYFNGLLKLKEYDNDLEEVVGLMKNYSNNYFEELPVILAEHSRKEQEQLKQIEELKQKLVESDKDQQRLKISLEKSEQQQVNLNSQLVTQQQQIQMQLQQQQQLQQIQMQQMMNPNNLDSKLQEEIIIEYRHLQLIAEEQNKEIEIYKEREGQIKELLLEFSKKGLIRIDENGDAFIRQINNNQMKQTDSDDNNSDKRQEYKQCKLHLKELISEQIGNNSVNGEQLADDSLISDSEESSFGFIGKVHMGYDDDDLDPIDQPIKKVNEKIRGKLKLNMAQVEETQKLIEEQQAIEDQKEKEILMLQQKQQQLKKQENKEIAKLQKTSQLKTQQPPKQQLQQQMSPQFNSNQIKSPPATQATSVTASQHIPTMASPSAPAIFIQSQHEYPKPTQTDNTPSNNTFKQQFQKITSKSPQSPQQSLQQLAQQSQQFKLSQSLQQQPFSGSVQPENLIENTQQIPKPMLKKLQLDNLYLNSTSQPKTVLIDNPNGGVGEYQKKEIQDISGMGYHDEFMSRLDEFSQSWRNAAEKERKPHTQF